MITFQMCYLKTFEISMPKCTGLHILTTPYRKNECKTQEKYLDKFATFLKKKDSPYLMASKIISV